MKAVFLSDGSNIATLCAKETRKCNVKVLLLVVGPNVTQQKAHLLKQILRPTYGLVISAKPYHHPKIKKLANSGIIDLLISCFYEHKIEKDFIESAGYGGINIHPSVLPYNGGFHSSFWGILNKNPLGATLHWLAPRLDSGGIIDQAVFRDNDFLKAGAVRRKQRRMCFILFKKNLSRILSKKLAKNVGKPCDFHKKRDIIKATTFKDTDRISFSRLCRLARATSYKQHGIRIKTKKHGLIIAKILIRKKR